MSATSDYDYAEAVTPSDTVAQTSGRFKGLYVGGAGNITVLTVNGAILFTAVPVGTTLRISGTRVNATATTATALVALYGS